MLSLRLWSVRHARGLRRVYDFCTRHAPLFAPLVRVIGPSRSEALLQPLEHATKRLMFDCQMCGQCVLSSTGLACPMNCAKQMRNGPCGGVRADGGCEVKPEMRCVWIEATEGAQRIAGAAGKIPAPLLPPLDHRLEGKSTWIPVVCGDGDFGKRWKVPASEPVVTHEAAPFELACNSGRFIVTVEVAPPDSADPSVLIERAQRFTGLVDAINITDGAGGNCHMSSVAASAVLATHGMTPVYQVACRDRNRIAIQGDILGAAALGVRNILCLTGDDVSQGDHPQAKPVFDLDSITLLGITRGMRDHGEYDSGRKLTTAPNLYLGATINPFVPPYLDRITNLEKKIAAGAQFIQTQFCFDVPMLEDFMREVRARELHKRCRLIVGVGTLGNAKALRWMAQHVPGVHIPEALLQRIGSAADQKMAGKRVCIETIQAVAGIEGVAGVHLMGHKNDDVLAEIIVEADLRQARPSPRH